MTKSNATTPNGLPIYANPDDFPDWRWKNFTPQEMKSKGPKGTLALDPAAMDLLQDLRDRIGKPFHIVSAYRSPEHNKAVGGAKRSFHMNGVAFDISMRNHDPHEFRDIAEEMGFDGIGTYPPARGNFIHIDTRGYRARWGDPF